MKQLDAPLQITEAELLLTRSWLFRHVRTSRVEAG
jgi:hypothetical protein